MTGAGMMDCKKALTATEGDMDKAVEFLREKGLATAAEEGRPYCSRGYRCIRLCSEDGKKAVVVEVNAETDFVAKNEKFQGIRCRCCCTGTEYRQQLISMLSWLSHGHLIPLRL